MKEKAWFYLSSMAARAPTIQARILDRIRARGRGRVYIPQDFLDLGARAAIDSALHRLVKAGDLKRPGRGLYHYPEEGRLGVVPPEEGDFIAAIGRRTGSVMQLAGPGALNSLGLSTQVPARSLYLTDGPSRTLSLGNRRIEFRNTSTRYLIEPGTTVGLVVQALRELGKEGVDPEVVAHLQGTLAEGDLRRLRRARRRLPAWMQQAIKALLEEPA